MTSAPTLSQFLVFLGFAAFSFYVLRRVFTFAMHRNAAMVVPPALTVFGVLAGYVFLRLKAEPFFIWYLIFLGLIYYGWRRKSRVDAAKLAALSQAGAAGGGAGKTALMESYAATRQLLSFGFLAYAAAFAVAFLYLQSRS